MYLTAIMYMAMQYGTQISFGYGISHVANMPEREMSAALLLIQDLCKRYPRNMQIDESANV